MLSSALPEIKVFRKWWQSLGGFWGGKRGVVKCTNISPSGKAILKIGLSDREDIALYSGFGGGRDFN